MTSEALAYAHFILLPTAILCLQYGWDMLMDDIVPMSKAQIVRRLS